MGYVQGMGYIAAIFLMYMGEEEAFWLLVALLKGAAGHEPLEGLFTPGLPLVQLCFFQLEGLLAVRLSCWRIICANDLRAHVLRADSRVRCSRGMLVRSTPRPSCTRTWRRRTARPACTRRSGS